jgi:hypothetical protein
MTPYQRRLVAAVEAEPGRTTDHYASVLGSTEYDVRRSGYLLWERGDLAGDDESTEPDVYLWPATSIKEFSDGHE